MFIDSPSSMCWQRRASKLCAEQENAYYTQYLLCCTLQGDLKNCYQWIVVVCNAQIRTLSLNVYYYLRCVPVLNISSAVLAHSFLCLIFKISCRVRLLYITSKCECGRQTCCMGWLKSLFGNHLLHLCTFSTPDTKLAVKNFLRDICYF